MGKTFDNFGISGKNVSNKSLVSGISGTEVTVSLSGTTESDLIANTNGSFIVIVDAVASGGPSGTFMISKTKDTASPLIVKHVSPGDTSGELLSLTWTSGEALKLVKSGAGHNGSYSVKII